jgi:integrase
MLQNDHPQRDGGRNVKWSRRRGKLGVPVGNADAVLIFDKQPNEPASAIELLTIAEAARLLKISKSGMRRIQQGRHISFFKVGLRRITWHVLRHTFATQLATRGAALNTVQVLLGHATISTTMRYAHVPPSALREAIGLLGSAREAPGDLGQPVGNGRTTVLAA